MLADCVEAKLLQELEIIHHGLFSGRGVDPIRPIALVQGSKQENELVIQQGSDDAIDSVLLDSTETSVTLNFVLTQDNCDVVQVG